MIKNETVLTIDNVTKFQNKFARNSNIFTLVMCVIVVACGIVEIVLKDYWFGAFCMVFGFAFFPIIILMQRIATKKNIQRMMLDGMINKYEFGQDNFTVITDKGGQKIGESIVTYNDVIKVAEYDDSFYIFISSRQAFIVDKKGFTEGSSAELSVLFATRLGNAYRVKLSKKVINENKKDA